MSALARSVEDYIQTLSVTKPACRQGEDPDQAVMPLMPLEGKRSQERQCSSPQEKRARPRLHHRLHRCSDIISQKQR